MAKMEKAYYLRKVAGDIATERGRTCQESEGWLKCICCRNDRC